MSGNSNLQLSDYLIDQEGIDWSAALRPWAWLVPNEFTVWMVNRIGDLILVFDDGTVHMLDVGGGSLTKLAASREELASKIDQGDNANQWLAIPLVDRLVAAGITLQQGQCYGFKQPPVLGGDYVVENMRPIAIPDYLGACGSIHAQLVDLADGTQVVLKVAKSGDNLKKDR